MHLFFCEIIASDFAIFSQRLWPKVDQDLYNMAHILYEPYLLFRDKTFGWHGYRSGLALYYFNLIHVQDEDHEVSITSNMNIYAQVIWRIR